MQTPVLAQFKRVSTDDIPVERMLSWHVIVIIHRWFFLSTVVIFNIRTSPAFLVDINILNTDDLLSSSPGRSGDLLCCISIFTLKLTNFLLVSIAGISFTAKVAADDDGCDHHHDNDRCTDDHNEELVLSQFTKS